jgi:hypothetical protein
MRDSFRPNQQVRPWQDMNIQAIEVPRIYIYDYYYCNFIIIILIYIYVYIIIYILCAYMGIAWNCICSYQTVKYQECPDDTPFQLRLQEMEDGFTRLVDDDWLTLVVLCYPLVI